MKRFSRLLALALMAVMLMSMVTVAQAEEKQSATAWLLYFASNHVTNSADFPWWPQHTSANQPSSETGVEATNAEVTGPGMYTVALKFNWQQAEGAIQFNLVLDNAEELFPGYYVDITDIRVNGKSIDHTENMYGAFHDNPSAGFVPMYNSYWDLAFSPDSTGPDMRTMRAFDGTVEDANYQIINPDDIVAGDTIEVDFVVAANAGEMPEDIGEQPAALTSLVEPPPVLEDGAKAWLFYQDGDWWPDNKFQDGDSFASVTAANVTGEGHYTTKMTFSASGWQPTGDGAQKLLLVLDDGVNKLPNTYLKVTDIRVNGNSINYTDVGYGAHYGDQYISADDTYSILFDKWMAENNSSPWNHKDWNGNASSNVTAINPDDLAGVISIEVDFFITNTAGVEPSKSDNGPVWYPNNTASVAGLTLKDLGIEDDWHAVVPVDLTKTGWQAFPMLAANFKQVGTAYVAVNNGSVSVICEYKGFYVMEKSQCIKWFTSLDQLSKAELTDISNGYTCDSVLSIADDLGGASIAYLSINNKITWRDPVDDLGNSLPDYWPNLQSWKDYRANLQAIIDNATAE